MRKFFLLFLFISFGSILSAQVNAVVPKDTLPKKPKGFMPGNIIIGANYGYPQVTAAVLRTAIKVYYKIVTDETMTFTVGNSGVLNAKAEYGINDNLGLGLASSYWSLDVNMANNYTSGAQNYEDRIDVKLSALALGVRGNYHFVEDLETTLIDPYAGITIGTTYYNKDVKYSSNNPDRQIPEQIPTKLYEFKDGWASYFSSTFGIRFYPIKYVGINFEAGWDRGAFLFAGAVIKLYTKPIKSFQD